MNNGEQFDGIGFAAGVVTGARSFKVDQLGRLTGVNFDQVWTPGENQAQCRKPENEYLASGITGNSHDALYRAMAGLNWLNNPVSIGGGRGSKPVPPDTSRIGKPDALANCAHGFYAYYDGSNDYKREGYVSGVIEGYGETVIGTRGFRSMKARIVALRIPKTVPANLAALAARNYASVPQFATFKAMVAAFPPDGGEQAVSPDTDETFWGRKI